MRLVQALRLALSLGLVGILIILVSQTSAREQIAESISSLSLQSLAFFTILFAFMRVLQAIALRQALSLYGFTLTLSQTLNLSALKGVFNLGFSGLGLAAQSAKARMELLVPVKTILLSNVVLSFSLIFALGCSLLLTTWLFHAGSRLQFPSLFWALGFGFLFGGASGLAFLVFPYFSTIRLKMLGLPQVDSYREEGQKTVLVTTLFMAISQIGVVAFRVFRVLLIAVMISPVLDSSSLALSVLAADTVGVIPITPGGIGVRELVIGIFGAKTENYESFLSVAIIDRILTSLLNAAHGTFAIWQSSRRE